MQIGLIQKQVTATDGLETTPKSLIIEKIWKIRP